MHRYLRWYAGKHKFYRILLLAGMGVGGLSIAGGFLTETGFYLLIGLFWLAGTPALVHLASGIDE